MVTINVTYVTHRFADYIMANENIVISVFFFKLIVWKECSKSGCLEIFSLRKMFHRILNPFVKNICLIPYNCWRINDWLQLRWKFINWISIRSWYNFANNFLSSFGSIKLCEDSFFSVIIVIKTNKSNFRTRLSIPTFQSIKLIF